MNEKSVLKLNFNTEYGVGNNLFKKKIICLNKCYIIQPFSFILLTNSFNFSLENVGAY